MTSTKTMSDLDRLREEASRMGFELVPRTARIANWHELFCSMIHQNQVVWAVKLWAEITRYQDPMKLMNVRAANAYVQAIRAHNVPLPIGIEHPDLP